MLDINALEKSILLKKCERYLKFKGKCGEMKIKGINSYFGGKSSSGTFQKIINQIRPHDTLIVPFLGNCGVTRNIKHCSNTIGIDINSSIIKKWRAMKFNWIHLSDCDSLIFLSGTIYGKQELSTVIYADPPYPLNSRKSQKKVYENELSNEDHERLLEILKKKECDVLISTYPNELYKSELKDWRYIDYNTTTRSGSVIERLYMNYDEPKELHDYRYLGDNYRQRERIKKKVKRYVENFSSLPTLEARAILKSIMETI